MDDNSDPHKQLPPSVSANIGTIAEYYARHEERVSSSQRIVEKVARFLGSSRYVVGNIGLIVGWIGINLAAPDLGWPRFDEPPFFWLQGIVGLNAFVISTTVLIRQNRMSQLAEQHAHLDLQVNLLTEQKSSKIISLLEELRRDLPNVVSKTDDEAHEMAKPADARAVLSAIEHEQGQRGSLTADR
jgi:uncharacterized membrane protein